MITSSTVTTPTNRCIASTTATASKSYRARILATSFSDVSGVKVGTSLSMQSPTVHVGGSLNNLARVTLPRYFPVGA